MAIVADRAWRCRLDGIVRQRRSSLRAAWDPIRAITRNDGREHESHALAQFMGDSFESEIAGLQRARIQLIAGGGGAAAFVFLAQGLGGGGIALRLPALPNQALACRAGLVDGGGERREKADRQHRPGETEPGPGAAAHPAAFRHCACRRRRSFQRPAQTLLPGAEQSVPPAYFQSRMALQAPS
ncbi:hypothetical protein SAMN05443579_10416 [Variovorax sp. PDC80]|nr:hypothetical protein SAMN05443579_10416 [Variovorax sp. PDC80]